MEQDIGPSSPKTADPTIHILSEDTINKIAAGEVIERPASVVKELIENSIDAGAQKVTLHIEAGGTSLIRVADDGRGIPSGQLPKTWLRHATSKISSAADLAGVMTHGFRGEALSSIASVSELSIETRYKEEETGQSVLVFSGAVPEFGTVSRATGTTVTVRKLFYNTPVRKKFLSSVRSEQANILKTVSHLALGYPSIAFRVYEGKARLADYLQDTRRNRIAEVLGRRLRSELLEVDFKSGNVHVSGYVGTPDHCRGNRVFQFFYINNRYITSPMLSRAFFTAYENLPPGKYPVGVLYLEFPGSDVDVNVHPSKKEVRFSDEKFVFSAVTAAIRKGLQKHFAMPEIRYTPPSETLQGSASAPAPGFSYREDAKMEVRDEEKNQTDIFLSAAVVTHSEKILTMPRAASRVGAPADAGARPAGFGDRLSMVPYLQLHSSYILFEVSSGLMVVNQQAAHQRVLYEEALEIFKFSGKISSQQLLFPEVFDFGQLQADGLNTHLKFFHTLGFDIESFGGSTFQIRGIPAEVHQNRSLPVIIEILQDLTDKSGSENDIYVNMAKAYARGAGIKTGDRLDYPKMSNLIDRLFATKNPFTSPFGKPVVFKFKLDDFHRKFGIQQK